MKQVYLLDDIADPMPIIARIKQWHKGMKITVVQEIDEVFSGKKDEVIVVRNGSGGVS